MAFNQTLSITQTDCCDTIQICDTTCYPDPCNAVECTDGYGVAGNPNKWDVASTRFNITFPDGNLIPAIDLSFLPNNKTVGSFEITAGTSGTIEVFLSGAGSLGITTFLTDLATTTTNLIVAINSNAANTKWRAYVDSVNDQKIWIIRTENGTGFNGVPAGYTASTDIVGAFTAFAGGTDDDDCKSITLAELWALNSGTVYNSNPGPAWADGVYKFEMISMMTLLLIQ